MKKLILIIFIFSLMWVSQTKADVYYEYNSERDYILITDSEWGAELASFTKKQVISTADIIKTTVEEKTTFRTGTKPISHRFRLSSGEYLVTFDAHWINNDMNGLDGADDWITVEIHKNGKLILPATVLGYCSNMRPTTQNCKNNWAVKVWLSGHVGKVNVTRILDEDIPYK